MGMAETELSFSFGVETNIVENRLDFGCVLGFKDVGKLKLSVLLSSSPLFSLSFWLSSDPRKRFHFEDVGVDVCVLSGSGCCEDVFVDKLCASTELFKGICISLSMGFSWIEFLNENC